MEKNKARKRDKGVGMELRGCQLNSEGRIFTEEIEEVEVRIWGRFIIGH